MSAVDNRTPILIGVAQFVQKCDPDDAKGPVEVQAELCRRAAQDATGSAEAGEALLASLDTLAVVSSTTDEPDFKRIPVAHLRNAPKAITEALGIAPPRQYKTTTGGNTPQMLVNKFAEEIAEGEANAVLVVGVEVLGSMLKKVLSGTDMTHWGDGNEPIADECVLGSARVGVGEIEHAHGLNWPTNTYAIFESAMRHESGRTMEEHQRWLGEFMHPFTKVAAKNPHAWFPVERSPEEISMETPQNRMVGAPYTKYLNSVLRVDQGAAYIMTSVEKARALGVREDKWVFLHGCGDANEIWDVCERVTLHQSLAISEMGRDAFEMAGWSLEDIDLIDIYSCFPSAVQAGCEALGIPTDDPRGLTITGGLPYFGGAGNAYVMCSIAEMVTQLRAAPGKKGMITANGWFLTKHAMGLYSTDPIAGKWKRRDIEACQARIDATPHPKLEEHPSGEGIVEGYTVVHSRDDIRMGVVIGMLNSGKRFIAHVPFDLNLLQKMKKQDMVGVRGTVTSGEKTNTFTPNW